MSAQLPIPAIVSGPLATVAAQLGNKTPVGAALNSAEWADVAVKLREDAFFSATLESVRAAGEMQRGLMDILEQTRRDNGTMATDRGKWVADMQALTTRLGLRTTDPDKIGGLQDIGSERRLKLIRDFQIESAQAKANHIAGQDPDVLQEWPAQELVRVVDSKVPRDWYARWQQAGGEVGWAGASQAGMVALKTSPIWMALSRFGRPYPPFDYNSGMDLRDIDREEAEALGLIAPGEVLEPSLEREAEVMEAGLKKDLELPGMKEALEELFGSQIRITDDGRAVWRRAEAGLLGSPAASKPLPDVPQPKPGRGVLVDPLAPSIEESANINSAVEVATVYSPEGRAVETVRGTATGVDFDPQRVAAGAYRNAIVTHNHPAGNSFSDRDLAFAASADLQELRVAARQPGGKSALFRLVRPASGWAPVRVLQDFHAEAAAEITERHLKERERGKLSGREARRRFAHEVLLAMGAKLGKALDYQRIDL